VFVQPVELVGADVLGAERFGGAAAVAGEVGDGADLGVDGTAGVVAQAQVVEEALAERGHGSPRREATGRWSGQGKDATQTAGAQIGTTGTIVTIVGR
jgi:hypothetical protein